MSTPTYTFLVVAAGRGSRFGGVLPKQYAPLGGVAVLARTVDACLSAVPDAHLMCVIHPDDTDLYAAALATLPRSISCRLHAPAFGGSTRQESVLNGLKAIQATQTPPDYVFVHDAARPFVSAAALERLVVAATHGAVAVVPSLPVVDTLKAVSSGHISGSIDREHVRSIQTPQLFKFQNLLDLHNHYAGREMTDDGSLFEEAGIPVMTVAGDAKTFKITTQDDLTRAKNMMFETCTDIRMGTGFDVHRFDEGSAVILGGVHIPHTHKLKGHSDADVALHAITDALLAAIADGDIGSHFPPSDAKWKGAASDQFLAFAGERVRGLGGQIRHISVTLICEAPKIGPHRDAIRQSIAGILGISVGRVSVQATTTEKLGFTGRGEGIAAQAAATVALPYADEAF